MTDQATYISGKPLSNSELLRRFDQIKGSGRMYTTVLGFIKEKIQPDYDLPLSVEYLQTNIRYILKQKTKLENPEVKVIKPGFIDRMLGKKGETRIREYSERDLAGMPIARDLDLFVLVNDTNLIAACEEARDLTNNQINLHFLI